MLTNIKKYNKISSIYQNHKGKIFLTNFSGLKKAKKSSSAPGLAIKQNFDWRIIFPPKSATLINNILKGKSFEKCH